MPQEVKTPLSATAADNIKNAVLAAASGSSMSPLGLAQDLIEAFRVIDAAQQPNERSSALVADTEPAATSDAPQEARETLIASVVSELVRATISLSASMRPRSESSCSETQPDLRVLALNVAQLLNEPTPVAYASLLADATLIAEGAERVASEGAPARLIEVALLTGARYAGTTDAALGNAGELLSFLQRSSTGRSAAGGR